MQVIIDGCKRVFEVDGMTEIKRISALPSMKRTKLDTVINKNGDIVEKQVKYDFPLFMLYTREIKTTKNGKDRKYEDISFDRNKLKNRIDEDLICPMNWLEERLDKIQNVQSRHTIPTEEFFIKVEGKADNKKMSRLMRLIQEYDEEMSKIFKTNYDSDEIRNEQILNITKTSVDKMSKLRTKDKKTVNRLIELAFGIQDTTHGGIKSKKYSTEKYSRKILNMLYKANRDLFLSNFSVE